MDEEFFVGLGVAWTHALYVRWVAGVDVAVDEVADDFDLAGDAEGFAGAVAEVGGDGGDAVRLVDAETGDGEVRAVESYECDVRAVQGGDEGELEASGG